MTEQERIEQIVRMLDTFAENGEGHMNVIVEEGEFTAQTTKSFSVDCDQNQGACSVPTLHQGIDE